MKTPLWLAMACLAASLPSHAEAFKPIELKDQELANLRGRYVMPGRIVSFGIVMSSTWQNANGDDRGNVHAADSAIDHQATVLCVDDR
jgi:hypothetical protein